MKDALKTLSKIGGFSPKTQETGPQYGGFNRRMMAATVDSLLMLPVAPLVDFLFNRLYKEIPIDWTALNEKLQGLSDPHQAGAVFLNALIGSGYLTRWLWGCVLQGLALLVVTGVCWHYWSATPGKILLRMKIVDAQTGGRMSTRQIILRLAGYIVSTAILFAGFVWIGIDKRRQGWHDKIADTLVVVAPWTKQDFATVHPSDSPAPSAME